MDIDHSDRSACLFGTEDCVKTMDTPAEFLFLGNGLVPPAVRPANSDTYSAIVLSGKVDTSELDAILDKAADPAVPIADFGNNHHLRRDYVGERLDADALAIFRDKISTIQNKLSDLPFQCEHGKRLELTVLRLAYSRSSPIEAQLTPNTLETVIYPLLGSMPESRRQLETLTNLDLLRRRHFTRTYVCKRCTSARLNARQICEKCGSTDLREESLVHHFGCGGQDAESSYVKGTLLICPKCNYELTRLGGDYDKRGVTFVCLACHARVSEGAQQFICLDCSEVMSGADIKSIDWFHYDLTDEGLKALRSGQLPSFNVAHLLEGRARVYSPQEFKLLATEFARVASRYDRAFTVARIKLNLDELHRKIGTVQADVELRCAIEDILRTMRSVDFASTAGYHTIVIGYPETSAVHVDVIFGRLRAALKSSDARNLLLETEWAEGDGIRNLLE